MKFIKPGQEVDFLGKRKITTVLSVTLILISIASLIIQGLNFGIEFTGGVQQTVKYLESADLEKVRNEVAALGVEDAVVRAQGDDSIVEISIPAGVAAGIKADDARFAQLCEASKKTLPNLQEWQGGSLAGPLIYAHLSCQNVGLQNLQTVDRKSGYSSEQKQLGILALIFALIVVFIYVAFRFEWRFSIGSVTALFHDVVITIGFFSVTQLTVDMAVLAALLAVIGYSLNDTIVVYDRIRERFRDARDGQTIMTMNTSINQTLSRTVVTSLTTLLVLIALAVLGGPALFGFSIALLVGVLIGTYSSVFVASTAALALGVTKESLMPSDKEEFEEEFADLVD